MITLKENHRQAGDKDYADILNRFRVAQQTEEDMDTLATRVRPLNHNDLHGAALGGGKKLKSLILN